jgi:hypothetical protein
MFIEAGFSVQKLVRRTEVSATTKLSSRDETPPIANELLAAGKSVPLMFCITLLCLLQGKMLALLHFLGLPLQGKMQMCLQCGLVGICRC